MNHFLLFLTFNAPLDSKRLFPERVWVNPLLEIPSLIILLGGIVIEQELLLDILINWWEIVSEQLEGGSWWETVLPLFVGLKTGAGRAGWGCNIATDDDMPGFEEADGFAWSNEVLVCKFTFVCRIRKRY